MIPPSGAAPLRWDLPCRVQAAFSTAADGDVRDDATRQRWFERIQMPHPCAVAQQVHGDGVVMVSRAGTPPQADGLVTVAPHLALGVFGADCPGLILIAPDALGAAHCGWRGAAAGMVFRLSEALARLSRHPPAQWTAFIGPGIAGAQYEVDAPVLAARDWPSAALTPSRAGHAQLDLPTVLASDCRQAGISQVMRSGIDTASDTRLHSYRHAGRGVIQMLVAWRDTKAAGG